jgi:hypothetical protein
MNNKYLVKIAESVEKEKLEDPNYLRMGGRSLLTAVGGNLAGGIIGGLTGNHILSAAGNIGGTVLGAYHGWKKSEKNQLEEQKIKKALQHYESSGAEVTKSAEQFEKSALNRFEQHLFDQPKGKKYSDPNVQRAYDLMQEHKNKLNEAEASKLTSKGGHKKLHQQADDTLRMHRGTTYTSSGAKAESKFKNTGDSLGIKAKGPKPTLNITLKQYVKKHPGKAALIASGGLAGLGAIGYGVKSSVE